jgi:hypothetical protein
VSSHAVQGRIVAQARFFLERHEQLDEPIEFLASANGATLTAEMLRVLIAEHDAYRDEVQAFGELTTEPDTTLTEDIAAVCDAAHDAWQRAHAENADRELIAYLAVTYDQAGRAKKADERARQAGT